MQADADIPDLSGSVTLAAHEAVFSGPYSVVKQGTLTYDEHPPTLVAVKIIRVVAREMSKMQRKIRRETQTWWMLRHPNVLPLMGVVEGREFGSFGGLVSPWCTHGNADQYLGRNNISCQGRMHLWSGVASAIEYLHNHNPRVIHADLKPSNILIDDNGNPLVCDFGLVRLQGMGRTGMTTTTAHTGTVAYLAHELVAYPSSVPSRHSDIHALGCIGLKFLLRTSPYGFCRNNVGAIYMQIATGRFPAERPPDIDEPMDKLWGLLETCWNPTPTDRPTATEVAHFILENGEVIASAIESTLETAEGMQTTTNGPIYADQPSNEVEWTMDRGDEDEAPELGISDNDSGFNAGDEEEEDEEYDAEETARPPDVQMEPVQHDQGLETNINHDNISSHEFNQTYRAFSITRRSEYHGRKDVGGKVILPAAAYDELAKADHTQSLNVEDSPPWILRLQNARKESIYVYAGVLDFTSEADCAVLPDWMMEALELDEEDEIQVKPVSLERAAYLKLLAKDKLFTDIPNPVDVIQDALRKFVCLTQDTVIQISHNDTFYEIKVQEARTAEGHGEGVSLVDAKPEIVLERWTPKQPPTRQNTVVTATESASATAGDQSAPVSALEQADNEKELPPPTASVYSRRSTAHEPSPARELSEKTETETKPQPSRNTPLPPDDPPENAGCCSKCIIC